LRGILQPLTERRMMSPRGRAALEEALRLADPAQGHVLQEDPVLGVAAPSPDAGVASR
jgi:hypothetical protein